MTFLMTFIDNPAATGTSKSEVDALGAGSVQEEIADRERVLHLGYVDFELVLFVGWKLGDYPLVNVYITMENHHF